MRHPAEILAAVLVVSACNETGTVDPPPPPPPPPPTILITGHDMGPRFNTFSIRRGTADMSTATVTLNGSQVPTTGNGDYFVDLGSFLGVGELLRLEVTHEGQTVTATAEIPVAPVVNSPDPLVVHPVIAGESVNFAWTSATNRDWWEVSLDWVAAGNNGVQDSLPGATRATSLSTATLPAAVDNFQGSVRGYVKGSFVGPAHTASNMRVRIQGELINFTNASPIRGP